MPEPGRNPLLDHNDSLPGKKPESVGDKVSAGFTKTKSFVSDSAHKVATSETYGKVKVGAGVAWDKTKDVSVAAAHAAKPAAIATKNAAVGLFEKTKAAFSKK